MFFFVWENEWKKHINFINPYGKAKNCPYMEEARWSMKFRQMTLWVKREDAMKILQKMQMHAAKAARTIP